MLFIAVLLQVYIIILQGYLILHGWRGKPEHKKKISKSLLVIDTISIKSVNSSWVTIVIYHNKIILPPESGLLHLYYKHAPCMQKAVFLFGFFNTPAWLSLTILLVFLRLYSAHGFLTKSKLEPWSLQDQVKFLSCQSNLILRFPINVICFKSHIPNTW